MDTAWRVSPYLKTLKFWSMPWPESFQVINLVSSFTNSVWKFIGIYYNTFISLVATHNRMLGESASGAFSGLQNPFVLVYDIWRCSALLSMYGPQEVKILKCALHAILSSTRAHGGSWTFVGMSHDCYNFLSKPDVQMKRDINQSSKLETRALTSLTYVV